MGAEAADGVDTGMYKFAVRIWCRDHDLNDVRKSSGICICGNAEC